MLNLFIAVVAESVQLHTEVSSWLFVFANLKTAHAWANINGIFELETFIVYNSSYWSYDVKTIFSLDNHVVVNHNKHISTTVCI